MFHLKEVYTNQKGYIIMTEKRYSYNPFTNDFFECSQSHSIALYNKGRQKQFDEYIRLIIVNNTLYIRLYYPFEDIDSLSLSELKQKSFTLIKQYEKDILSQLKNLNITPDKIVYNVDNDLLKGIRLANI